VAEAHVAETTEFLLADLEQVEIPDGFTDVVISNCVINLCPDKEAVYREAFRVLRHLNGALAAGISGMVNGKYLPGKDEVAITLVNEDNRRSCLIASGGTVPSNECAPSGCMIDLLSGERVQTTRTQGGDFEPRQPSGLCLWVPDG